MKPTLTVGDLFCGAGGSSYGVLMATRALGSKIQLTGINHWDVAISTHTANLPDGRHLHAELDDVSPDALFKAGELDFLWASPECTHHSNARGGKPCDDQSRSSAFRVIEWAKALLPGCILVENVPEFQTWGPLVRKRVKVKKAGVEHTEMALRPDPKRKGETYQEWLTALRDLGYTVEAKVLRAADYGDPTSRRRLFVQAVRGDRKIVWPQPTHAEAPQAGSGLQAHVTAREIIDWELPSASIFSRTRPLSPNTIRRIEIGLEKYGLTPFIAPQQYQNRAVKSVGESGSTATTRGEALVEPFIVKLQRHGDAESMDKPIGSIRAQGTHYALAEPRLVQVVQQGADTSGVKSSDTSSIGKPVPAVTGNPQQYLMEPYLVKYFGTANAASVHKPLSTVTAKGRHGLVQPLLKFDDGEYLLDIHFRMLQPTELAAAQGFPKGYKFTGNKTQTVKQIGNAVPCHTACALTLAMLGQQPDVRELMASVDFEAVMDVAS